MRNTKILLVILLIIVLILILLTLLLGGFKKESNKPKTPPTPPSPSQIQTTPTANPTVPVITPKPITKEQLIKMMPVQQPEFNIEYLSKSDIFLVTIKESPYDQNKEKSKQWLIANGVTDFQKFNIQWRAYPYVQ